MLIYWLTMYETVSYAPTSLITERIQRENWSLAKLRDVSKNVAVVCDRTLMRKRSQVQTCTICHAAFFLHCAEYDFKRNN